MALPQWQSLDQIVGTMAVNFVSRLDQANITPGLEDLKPGSPFLAIFQSVGQSRMRGQQQMMDVLDSNNVDSPEADLDRIGNGENIPRLGQTFSRGTVDISDTRFQKIASKLYHGSPAPIPGTLTLYVVDASKFPTSGKVYIGRGTSNFEGPLSYTSVSNMGTYWAVNLTTGTLNFHALTEVVTVAQGGDRSVGAGQVVRTPAGGSVAPVNFATTQAVVVPDGETLLQGVSVVCQTPGRTGNVAKGAIKDVVSPAFSGMAVTNPLPIQNARDSESDNDYRARIKATKAARELGTKTAIETFAVGVTSPDENSQVTTANLVKRSLRPTILTIDDGSGYEEKTEGINYEVLVDSANGGESTFSLTYGRPVAKAQATTLLVAPFALTPGCVLAVLVGGVHYEHTFASPDFRSISNATAYEVVASINADASLPYSARTVDGGAQVSIFAKAETQDDIQVTAPYAGVDANTFLGFPTARYDTLRLYKNDRLLQKDGRTAVLSSQGQGSWSPMSSGETLIVNVDGTGSVTFTFNDVDFTNAGTGYNSVSATNPLSTWATVLNAKLPGITTTVNGSFLELTSNKGLTSKASIVLDPTSTLVIKGMFPSTQLSAQGRDFDYTLDRNTGQVELVTPLVAGDRLSAGTPFTRAYIQSTTLGATITIAAGGARLWFVVDGGAATIPTGLNGAVYLSPSTSAGLPTVTITAKAVADGTAVPNIFSKVRVGDWYIQTTAVAPLGTVGAWRVSEVDPNGEWFKVEIDWASYTLTDSDSTVFAYTTFVRATSAPQQVTITAGTYTLAQLAALLAPKGASASVVSNTLRVSTNTYATSGDIALVAQDTNAPSLFLPLGLVTNNEPHVGAVLSGNSEKGTPNFVLASATSLAGSTLTASAAILPEYREGMIDQAMVIRPALSGVVLSRYSTLDQVAAAPGTITSSTVFDIGQDPTLLVTNALFANQPDRLVGLSAYRFGPNAYLNATMNKDPIGGGFSVPMFRQLIADPAVVYGGTLRLKDKDLLTAGVPSTLDKAFGTTFDFSNFALHMRARGQTDAADATRSILWRKADYVGAVSSAVVQYVPPTAPAQNVSVSIDEPYGNISVHLPSGAQRAVTLSAGQMLYHIGAQKAVISAYAISSMTRAGGTTVTATVSDVLGVTGGTGMTVGMSVYVNVASANFSSGVKTITAAAANSISWAEAGSNVTESPARANVGWAASPIDFTAVQVSDYTTGWAGYFSNVPARTLSVSAVSQYAFTFSSTDPFANATATVATTSDFKFYPVASATAGTSADLTATLLVTKVNALANPVVTGAVTGTGVGIITQGYPDDASARASLQDGILLIKSGTWNAGAGNYDLTLKFVPQLSGLDYSNELFRLVPTTAKNVADFLATAAVTGLTLGGGSVQRAGQAVDVQLATTTLGSDGAVQVTGGNANDLRLTAVDSATLVQWYVAATTSNTITLTQSIPSLTPATGNVVINGTTYAYTGYTGAQFTGVTPNPTGEAIGSTVTVPYNFLRLPVRTSADLSTLGTKSWALIDTNAVTAKTTNWAAGSTIQFWAAGSKVKVTGSGATAWARTTTPIANGRWYVEKHGRFVAYTVQGAAGQLVGLSQGDWVVLGGSAPAAYNAGTTYGANDLVQVAGTVFISLAGGNLGNNPITSPASWAYHGVTPTLGNLGTFRVIAVNGNTFWVDNPSYTAQDATFTSFKSYTYDSVMPGDTFQVGTSAFGATNQGVMTVLANDDGLTNDQGIFYVTTTTADSGPTAIGTNLVFLRLAPSAPVPCFARIRNAIPSPTDSTITNLYLDVAETTRPQLMGTQTGSVVQALDRLEFSTSAVVGQDGYIHDIGLIAAVNQVLYGDESDPDTYPGVIAVGDDVFIQPPLVRRVFISVAVREVSGANTTPAVQAAIASVIAQAGGKPVPISEYVAAAQQVPGVLSVVPVSPVPTEGADTIPVEPGEKATIVDIDNDIQVNLIGQ